jgi:RNA-binding protein 25
LRRLFIDGLPSPQESPASEPAANGKATIKEIIKSIPIDKQAVFAYPIKWDAYDQHSKAIVPKLSQWVSKKVAELLAEDESVVKHIMSMVAKHSQPAAMVETLSFLDKDAEPFVHTLFRMIILETEKASRGITE